MTEKANLKTTVQGIKGGDFSPLKEKGCIISYVDKQANLITLDSFQGTGLDYEKREETLITIRRDGKNYFNGTFDELCIALRQGMK